MAGSRQGQGQAFRRQSDLRKKNVWGFPNSYPLSSGVHGVGWRRGTGDRSLRDLQGAGSSQAWELGVPWPWPSREGGQSQTQSLPGKGSDFPANLLSSQEKLRFKGGVPGVERRGGLDPTHKLEDRAVAGTLQDPWCGKASWRRRPG